MDLLEKYKSVFQNPRIGTVTAKSCHKLLSLSHWKQIISVSPFTSAHLPLPVPPLPCLFFSVLLCTGPSPGFNILSYFQHSTKTNLVFQYTNSQFLRENPVNSVQIRDVPLTQSILVKDQDHSGKWSCVFWVYGRGASPRM